MKALKAISVAMVATFLTICLINFGEAQTFHAGGVAYCDGCHTMHNSVGGAKAGQGQAAQYTGNQSLLIGTDQSSTCLFCHASTAAKAGSYHVFTSDAKQGTTAPANYTPGGDFAWLTFAYTATSDFQTSAVAGERHGHNVIAKDFSGLAAPDSTLTTAPGGTYSNANLSCISCHDPHPSARINASGTLVYRGGAGSSPGPIIGSGSYADSSVPTGTDTVGVYRLLGGNNYVPKSYTGGPAFTNDPPIAVAPHTYNRKEDTADTRVAYGKGMSEWCTNCHTKIHADDLTNLIHPASNLALLKGSVDIASNYNMYVKSGDLTGAQANSYTSMVPFEEGTTTIATLKGHAVIDGSQKGGPTTGSENVMCLSCHRAHATGFNHMTRWDNDFEFITESSAYPVSATATSIYNAPEYLAAMYGRPASIYATFQRSLCNKCHVKD